MSGISTYCMELDEEFAHRHGRDSRDADAAYASYQHVATGHANHIKKGA